MGMNVTIIGTGYVGLTTGVAFAFLGHDVTCIDKNPDIVATLRGGTPTIHEPGLEELMNLAKSRMTFSEELPELDRDGIVMIAVGTPSKHNGDADMSYVDAAAHEVAGAIRPGVNLTIVNKSTVPIGSARHVEGIVRRTLDERGVDARVEVASVPEFLAEGKAVHDSLYPDRVVIGAEGQQAVAMLRELYGPILEQTFEPPTQTPRPERYPLPSLITTTPTSAELTKYAANSFLATKISFINEFAGLAEKVGADITQVARAIGLDSRIGPRFLHAGIGWGGSCFGKDTKAIVQTGASYDYDMPIVRAAIDVNMRQRLRVVEKLQDRLKVLRGTTIGLLGLAFKGDTNDLRDSPALTLIEHLNERGAVVKAHDPVAIPEAKKHFPDLPVQYCDDPVRMATGCDAVVLVTDWPQYRTLPFDELRAAMRGDVLLDARNYLNADDVRRAELTYVGTGR